MAGLLDALSMALQGYAQGRDIKRQRGIEDDRLAYERQVRKTAAQIEAERQAAIANANLSTTQADMMGKPLSQLGVPGFLMPPGAENVTAMMLPYLRDVLGIKGGIQDLDFADKRNPLVLEGMRYGVDAQKMDNEFNRTANPIKLQGMQYGVDAQLLDNNFNRDTYNDRVRMPGLTADAASQDIDFRRQLFGPQLRSANAAATVAEDQANWAPKFSQLDYDARSFNLGDARAKQVYEIGLLKNRYLSSQYDPYVSAANANKVWMELQRMGYDLAKLPPADRERALREAEIQAGISQANLQDSQSKFLGDTVATQFPGMFPDGSSLNNLPIFGIPSYQNAYNVATSPDAELVREAANATAKAQKRLNTPATFRGDPKYNVTTGKFESDAVTMPANWRSDGYQLQGSPASAPPTAAPTSPLSLDFPLREPTLSRGLPASLAPNLSGGAVTPSMPGIKPPTQGFVKPLPMGGESEGDYNNRVAKEYSAYLLNASRADKLAPTVYNTDPSAWITAQLGDAFKIGKSKLSDVQRQRLLLQSQDPATVEKHGGSSPEGQAKWKSEVSKLLTEPGNQTFGPDKQPEAMTPYQQEQVKFERERVRIARENLALQRQSEAFDRKMKVIDQGMRSTEIALSRARLNNDIKQADKLDKQATDQLRMYVNSGEDNIGILRSQLAKAQEIDDKAEISRLEREIQQRNNALEPFRKQLTGKVSDSNKVTVDSLASWWALNRMQGSYDDLALELAKKGKTSAQIQQAMVGNLIPADEAKRVADAAVKKAK